VRRREVRGPAARRRRLGALVRARRAGRLTAALPTLSTTTTTARLHLGRQRAHGRPIPGGHGLQ
jgi:hypothetical protein